MARRWHRRAGVHFLQAKRSSSDLHSIVTSRSIHIAVRKFTPFLAITKYEQYLVRVLDSRVVCLLVCVGYSVIWQQNNLWFLLLVFVIPLLFLALRQSVFWRHYGFLIFVRVIRRELSVEGFVVRTNVVTEGTAPSPIQDGRK